MKCPNCGAEVNNTKFCEFCGSQITQDMQKEQEQINKQGCPKCGSSNITFKRENQGEVRDKSSKTVIHKTVGVCKDCGYTWFANGENEPKKRKTWLWVLGWIFIFPLPLTLILVKKKEMNNILKYAIIAVAWIVYLIIAFSGSGGDSTKTKNASDVNNKTTVTTEATTKSTIQKQDETTKENSYIPTEYYNAWVSARNYLKTQYFSKKGLIEQLKYEKYSEKACDYAIKNLDVDWKVQAVGSAKQYLDTMSFSKQELIEQLEYDGFTHEEAIYGVNVAYK